MDREKSRPSDASAPPAVERAALRDHPVGFWFFFWGEFAERCCYYGMRAILLLYMIQVLNFEDGKASQIQSYFMAACYLLPLVGGFVADNYLGKYRTIVYFSVPYIFGQIMLGIAALHNETCLYFSLGLLAMGTGVIKPNISTLMGLTYDQQRPGRTKLRSDAFALFYGAINIGAAISSFCVPWIRTTLGGDSQAYAIAFLFPAALMIAAFIVFAAGKPFYAHEKIQRLHLTPEQRRERLVVLSRLFGLFLVVAVFWSIYDQSVSTRVLFTRDYLDLNEFGFRLSPDQIQAINPVLIVLLLPPITLLWHWLTRVGLDLKPTSKMLIGFVLTGATMGIIAWAGFHGVRVVKAGAPAALVAAEGAAEAAMQAADNSAANAAADNLLAACAAKRAVATARDALAGSDDAEVRAADLRAAAEAAEAAASAVSVQSPALAADSRKAAEAARRAAIAHIDIKAAGDAAKQAMETAGKALEETDPLAILSASAARAGNAATHAARAAYALVGSTATTGRPRSGKRCRPARRRRPLPMRRRRPSIWCARRPTSACKRIPSSRSNSRSSAPRCSGAANRASAAATAATRSAKAIVKADNLDAAEVHAAVASLAAADAASQAAQAAAEAQGKPRPAIVGETEAVAASARISLLWQLIPYVIITIAEICISVVGLELAFAAAPASMKSFVTACWLLTVFFGNILNAQITPLYNGTLAGYCLMPGPYFLAFALVMVPVTAAFLFFARRFNDGNAARP